MNTQEELVRSWRQQLDNEMFENFRGFLLIAKTFKMDDPGHIQPQLDNGLSQTMIYTGEEAKALADKAVEEAVKEGFDKANEELSEAEKDRLWKAVLESCSG